MNPKQLAIVLLTIALISCNSTQKEKNSDKTETYPDIKIVGAMKNVMWKGELGSSIDLDTIANKNGISYISKVTSDSTMTVKKTYDTSAPFFVYGNVTKWHEIELPSNVKSIRDLEKFIGDKTTEFKRPFAFKLIGQVSNAIIHIQNLPKGTKVSSPDEAHQGQINYNISNEDAEIIGFFSTQHKGIFTHHDSFLHMHLITKDESKMGHLDELEIEKMKLYLPLNEVSTFRSKTKSKSP